MFKLYERQRIDKVHAIEDKNQALDEVDSLNEELEDLKGKQNPLLPVGIAVRKRFFEQARVVVPERQNEDEDNEEQVTSDEEEDESSWGAPNKTVVEEGNVAAHRGNADADNALFRLGYLKSDKLNRTIPEKLFQSMYRVYPEEYSSLEEFYLPRLRKMFNCEATVLTVPVLNNAAQREKKKLLSRLTSLSNKLRYGENEVKEADTTDLKQENELNRLAEEAEKISMDFVEEYRKR